MLSLSYQTTSHQLSSFPKVEHSSFWYCLNIPKKSALFWHSNSWQLLKYFFPGDQRLFLCFDFLYSILRQNDMLLGFPSQQTSPLLCRSLLSVCQADTKNPLVRPIHESDMHYIVGMLRILVHHSKTDNIRLQMDGDNVESRRPSSYDYFCVFIALLTELDIQSRLTTKKSKNWARLISLE